MMGIRLACIVALSGLCTLVSRPRSGYHTMVGRVDGTFSGNQSGQSVLATGPSNYSPRSQGMTKGKLQKRLQINGIQKEQNVRDKSILTETAYLLSALRY